MTFTSDVTCCPPPMMGVGGPAPGAAAVVSLAKNGFGGDGGGDGCIPTTPSIIIDFTPVTLSPKAVVAISALFLAFGTACFKDHFDKF